MFDNPTATQRWTYFVFAVCLVPVADHWGALWGWTPGMAAFALLVVPTCAMGLSACRRDAHVAAALAGMATFADAWCFSEASDFHSAMGGSSVTTAVLLLLSYLVSAFAREHEERVQGLQKQNDKYIRDLYESERRGAGTPDSKEGARDDRRGASCSASPGEPDSLEDVSVNQGLLLLTLQDIGRKVSTHLDLATLIPTVITTAKSTLKCGSCELYSWDRQLNVFVSMLPVRSCDRNQYTPRPQHGMAGWVLEHNQILTRKDVEEDYELQELLEEDSKMPDAITPLSVGGELLGVLVVNEVEDSSSTFVRLLYILSNMYALGIKNAQLFTRIEEMARHDGLTGLLNHASFQEVLSGQILTAKDGGDTVSVVMSDIDHFKKFNDTWGHQAGDHVLREVARMWSAVLPEHAILARYGGEEFICALPGDDLSRATELAELLRVSVEEHTIDFEGQELHVTSSFGVAQHSSEVASPEELVKTADQALYRAKEAGRNCVAAAADHHTLAE